MSDDKTYTITVDSGSVAVPTFDTSLLNDTGTEYTFNIGSSDITDTITVDVGSDYNYTGYNLVDNWPSEYKILDMVEHYPALKIQYEKFLEIYNLVKDDYKNKEDNDDISF